jgi:hypothetical protein
MDPAIGEDVGVRKPEADAEIGPQPAEDVVRDGRAVGHDEHEVAGVGAGPRTQPLREVLAEELDDRTLDRPGGFDREMRQALRPEALRGVRELVDPGSGRVGQPRHGDRLDPAAARERVVEHPEPRGGRPIRTVELRGQVDELHREAHIRLVRSEPLHRLVEGEARERRGLQRPLGRDGSAHRDRHPLDEVHHRGLVDEAHLEIQLRELRLAIASKVLVPEAAGDLEIAIDAADHEELLELLGALRQGVDRTRLEPRWDDEVAGTLGRRLDEVRRLDLDEAAGVVDLANGLDEPAPEQQALLHRLAADVEIAVLEADRLVHRSIRFVDVEGRCLGVVQDRHPGCLELDLAGREAGVLRAGPSKGDRALDRDHELGADAGRDLVCLRRVRPIDDDLGQPMAVPQVEEDRVAVVAATMDPARELRRAGCVGSPERTARMAAVGRGEAGACLGHGFVMVSGGEDESPALPGVPVVVLFDGPGDLPGEIRQGDQAL